MSTRPSSVQLDPSDPRSESFDWRAWARWEMQGETAAIPSALRPAKGPPTDIIAAGISGLLVPPPMRELFEQVAPGDLQFHPVTVDGEDYWLTRVATVLDALDLTRGDIPLRENGTVKYFNYPVWKREVLDRQAIFRIPQDRGRILCTDEVAAAYLSSGYTGLTITGPKGEILPAAA